MSKWSAKDFSWSTDSLIKLYDQKFHQQASYENFVERDPNAQVCRLLGPICVPKAKTSGHPIQPGPGGGERGLEDTGEQVLDYDYEDTTYSPRILGLLFTLFRPRKSLTFHVFCRPPPPSFQSEGLVKGLFTNIPLFACSSVPVHL